MHSWNRDSSPALEQLFSLKGKNALVTGGAGLLGSQIASALAEQGARVAIASRTADNCVQLANEFEAIWPAGHYGLPIDITDTASVKGCVDEVVSTSGGIDILVNCSWSGNKNSWESISEEDWMYDIDVTLHGVFRTIKAAFDPLKVSKGKVLNIASMYGYIAPDHRMYDGEKYANPPSYGAGKAAVIQFTKYLASFLSPHEIRVNAISPGPFPYESTQKENPEFIERLGAKNPIGRIGNPYELKGAAALLCSDASSYMTGQNVCVDGGWGVW